jgi:hypothetical protein
VVIGFGKVSKKEIRKFFKAVLRDKIISNMSHRRQKRRKDLGDIFDKHVKYEFIDHDVEATMKTMVNEPIVHNVPVLTGGVSFDNVFNFYKKMSLLPRCPMIRRLLAFQELLVKIRLWTRSF